MPDLVSGCKSKQIGTYFWAQLTQAADTNSTGSFPWRFLPTRPLYPAETISKLPREVRRHRLRLHEQLKTKGKNG